MRLNGVDEDLAAFCHAEHARLVGMLSLYCGDRDVAEELAQDAIARVVSEWKRVRDFRSPAAWSYRVAINLANSHFRRRLAERRATLRLSSRAGRADDTPDVPSAVAVRAAVAQLPKRQRAVVVLRYFADLSVHDVSELLGFPEGTVKTLTAKALAALRASDLVDSHEVTDDA